LVQVGRAAVDERDVTGGPGTRGGTPWEAALPLVGALLALLFAAFGVLHLLLLEAPARLALAGLAGLLAAGTLTGSAVAWWRGVPEDAVRPLGATYVVLLAGHCVAAMVATGELAWSVGVLLAVVASGVLLSRLRWLVGTLYIVWGVWLAGMMAVGPDPQWPVYAVTMLAGTVLAAGVLLGARRLLDTLATTRELAEVVAVRDPLTGLANRRGLQMLASPIVESARRQGDAVHAVFLHVDGLIAPDGTRDYPAGDEVVLSVGEALTSVTRATDVVARWDTHTFVLVGPGPGITPLELERRVRDRLVVVAAFDAGWRPRVSAGGAMLAPWDAGTLDTQLEDADGELDRRRALHRRDRRGAQTATD
jgi:diguanylate cyclase (GGDEF)-like protein